METSDYEAFLKDQGAKFDQIHQLKNIARLRDIARNLESLGKLADAEAKERELKAKLFNPRGTTEEDAQV
jgi:hypothetical protein